MKTTSRHSPSVLRSSGFSLVEMIGVLAIIAILAAVIVPKVISTIASSRVTSAVGSVSSMKTAVTEFAGKYGTIPYTSANSRLDDLLMTTGSLDSRFTAKIGNPPASPTREGAAWSNASGAWVESGGASQVTGPVQSRVICIPGDPNNYVGYGNSYKLNGTTTLPAGARVVSAVLADVAIHDAVELSLKLDGEALSQPSTSVETDTLGRVTYATAQNGLTTVYVYITHQ